MSFIRFFCLKRLDIKSVTLPVFLIQCFNSMLIRAINRVIRRSIHPVYLDGARTCFLEIKIAWYFRSIFLAPLMAVPFQSIGIMKCAY